MKTIFPLILLTSFLISSCSIYRRSFDCPPSEGMPCTSVTDIEQMVIETPSGPDLFGVDAHERMHTGRIWISTQCGRGYYIPVNPEDLCCKH